MAGAARPVGGWLLERGGELARIGHAIEALQRGDGGVLVIQGVAGIGKSALLRALCEQATSQGVQTFCARASELEREFGFGVIRQLLETRVIHADELQRAELLSGAARLAGPVLSVSGGSVGDPFAALHGLYWLVANLSARGPAVLAVDDLHWADEPSLRWLVYLCHRLEGLPVLVAATTRPPRPGHPALLAELLTVTSGQVLCPGALSESAVARLLCEGLGAEPDPVFVSACATATAGNPFVLRELIFELTADGVTPVAAQAAGVTQRVPGQVQRVVLARLGRLDQSAVRLARAVAVLGEGTELRLAAAFAELDIDTAAEAADVLLTADLFDESRPLRLAHPLVRSAIYEQFPPGARSQAHARAARLLAGEGTDPEQVAAQLLKCDPAGDMDAVQILRDAAAAALARGVPEIAVVYLRRALAEPPAERLRATVLAELGGAERFTRDPAAAVHLEQAWQAATDPVARAQLTDQLANVLWWAGDMNRCATVLQAGLEDLGDADPDIRVRLYTQKVAAEIFQAPSLERLCEMAEWGLPSSRLAQLVLAPFLAARGENCHQVAELVERGWDDGRLLAEETSDTQSVTQAVFGLGIVDELERAQTLIQAMLADAEKRGSVTGFATFALARGWIALRRGELAEAEADTRAAFELTTEHHLTHLAAYCAANLGLMLLQRGDLQDAAAVVDSVTITSHLIEGLTGLVLMETRGRVRLARGQRAQAIADLRRCGQLADHARLHNPNLLAWRSTLALALAPEHLPEARELAQAELGLARRANVTRAIGIALRVCGQLADPPDRIELLEQSVAMLEPTPMRLELAHSLTELGAALRRAGARTAARQPLRHALDLAHRCGAIPLAQRARDEAVAAGARPRRPFTTGLQALTPSELRVARLAAQPMTNRDIAQALFITTKTVSDHLSSTYRKLNISSRTELVTAMTAHAPPRNTLSAPQ